MPLLSHRRQGARGPLVAAAAAASICSLPIALADQQRVLFLGNSFSFVCGSVWPQYEKIAEACIPGLDVITTFKGEGAGTLRMAAEDPETSGLVRAGNYDLLVLQDQSELAESGADAVRTLFAPEAAKHGAKIGFYETWASPDADGNNLTSGTELRRHYYENLKAIAIAKGVPDVTIARAGEAWQRLLEQQSYDWEMPSFRAMYADDFDHPSTLGLNLVAWVMVLRYNADRFGPQGCDPYKVPNIAGQSDQTKQNFARIACELAGVCAHAAPPQAPPLCPAAQRLQGEWNAKKSLSKYECQSLRSQGATYLRPDCTYIVKYNVRGTEIIESSRGETKIHHLRVNHIGDRCVIKLIPAFSYLASLTSDKLSWNNCDVWTRPSNIAYATADECWCMHSDSWTDGEGDGCPSYGEGRKKSLNYCRSEGSEHVSAYQRMTAKQACPGCQQCTMPPAQHASSRRLTFDAEGNEQEDIVVV